MVSDDIHYLGLREVAQLLHSGMLSPVELARAMLSRIEQVDGSVQSFFTVTAEAAMNAARTAEAELGRGAIRGPLHGVPVAIKDIFRISGQPPAAGMAIHQAFVAGEDATVVRRLQAAGAIVLGTLNLTEGVYAEHRAPFKMPVNPWNRDFWPGASSSGSGVAVASGLCFAALASETGGSIKLPSAANGVTGLKPTWGRVSRHGVFELAATLDHVGAIARSAADAAVMLQTIAGADPLDPTAAQNPVPAYLDGLDDGVRGLRVGIDPAWTQAGVDSVTAGAVAKAIQTLRDLGAETEEVQLPDPTAMIWDWFGVCAVQTAVAHEATYPRLETQYGPALSDLLKTGRAMSGMDYQKLLLRREDFRGRMNAVFEQVDLLAMPVLAFPTPSLARMNTIDDALIAGLHRYTCPFNMSGHPGIVMPCGFTADRTPIVFQLVGPHFAERRLLTAAHAYQQVTEWHRVHPLP